MYFLFPVFYPIDYTNIALNYLSGFLELLSRKVANTMLQALCIPAPIATILGLALYFLGNSHTALCRVLPVPADADECYGMDYAPCNPGTWFQHTDFRSFKFHGPFSAESKPKYIKSCLGESKPYYVYMTAGASASVS